MRSRIDAARPKPRGGCDRTIPLKFVSPAAVPAEGRKVVEGQEKVAAAPSEGFGKRIATPLGIGSAYPPMATAEESDRMRYMDQDGREWEVSLEAPGKVLSVAPELERSGALLPEHQLQIVFESGEERYSEEYTEMAALEDLSEDELEEWLRAARRGKGV